jgi:UDP-2,3-diacylglucosamine hydrolase
MSARTAVFFISDAHLGAEPEEAEAEREARLHEFLGWLPENAAALYIVGDLFEFWFEYRTAIPRRHFRTLCALHRLRAAGVELHYLPGNHDFWLGEFLHKELGAHCHAGPVEVDRQGRRLFVHHGDGLAGGDLGYRMLKSVLRHPASIGLYRLLHPDLGIPLAHAVSRLSRRSQEGREPDLERLFREIAQPRFAQGFDAVVVGHFHHVYERREAGREFFVIGDWMQKFTYLELRDGELTLRRWPDRFQN